MASKPASTDAQQKTASQAADARQETNASQAANTGQAASALQETDAHQKTDAHELPDPRDLPVEDDRVYYVGLPLEALDPVRFSVYGLDESGQSAVKDLALGVNVATSGLRSIHDFLPVDYDLSKMRDGLHQAVYCLDRLVNAREPIAYLTDQIDSGLGQARHGLSDLVVDLKARDIESPVLHAGIHDLDKGLSIAESNLDVIDACIYC